MELPYAYALPDPTKWGRLRNFWAIRWLQYDINGDSHLVYTTYYNNRDGWYFVLPDEWWARSPSPAATWRAAASGP